MKRVLFLTSFFLFSCFVFGQVETTTIKSCNIFNEYTAGGFKKNKKIKANTPITLIDEFPQVSGYYSILYNNDPYCIDGVNISASAVASLKQQKEDILKREKFVKDSIQSAKDEANRVKWRAEQDRKDSIAKLKKSMLDSLEYLRDIKEEGMRRAYQEIQDSLFKAGYPIQIEFCNVGSPNSAGGCILGIGFKNLSKKEIKYVYLTGYVVNAVKDRVSCTVRRYSSTTVRGVGPIEPGEEARYDWDNVWYNHTIDWFVPTQIKLEYMNGTVSILNQAKIKQAMGLPDYGKIVKRLFDKIDKEHKESVRQVENML